MVGTKTFFLDTHDFEIKEGIILGVNLSTTGYILYSILTDDGSKLTIEEAHCHKRREDAGAHKKRVMPIIKEAEEEKEKITKVIDEKRIDVIGEPALLDLAKKVSGGK